MRILVLGKNGQVGQALSGFYSNREHVVFAGRAECDCSRPDAIRALVRQVKPEVIINAAAYTAVDLAEQQRDLCFAVNAEAPAVLAEEAKHLEALLVHYSTDYVFDGEKDSPYVETDTVHPLNVYGRSKAEGEAAIAQVGGRFLVLRTSWVYSAGGKSFLRTMLRLGAERPELKVVDDQLGAPTSSSAIAAATGRLVDEYDSIGAQLPLGLYHMSAGGATTWFGFARNIFLSGLVRPAPHVHAIASSEYPTAARRPANSVLSNEKFAHDFGFRLPDWHLELQRVLDGIAAGA